ncbi:uncharacterized protein LOC117123337 [Anneissia japonica]|uniref:uncharacterized protein LOC117123337 n=1 Tax=Anneissia japonica TaxID=1529436 RepID=UPI001425978C|nr:uncharacterized protein LOC117123337 [Anneissia japonica]
MLGKSVALVLLFFVHNIAFSEQGGTCKIQSLKSIPGPSQQIDKYQTSSGNKSLDIKSCGPPGTPDIIYKVKPEKITAKSRSVEIELTVMLLAAITDGGYADVSVLLGHDDQPIRFFSAIDCGMLHDDIECPLPLSKKDWLYVKAVCDTRFYLPNLSGKVNAKITNYNEEEVVCFEGQFRTF